MTQPLTPIDCDLKDFAFIPIEVTRFLDSSFNATLNDTAWRAGVTLWMKAWHQVPAASLPDDDATLANLSGLGRDVKTWRKIKAEAMRGWIKADDGLLYHPVVAEKALEAWLEKLCQRLSSGSGNATRWGASFDPVAIQAQIADAVALLSALNPNSKALAKKRKKPSEKHPDGTTPGEQSGNEPGVPSGSQEKGQGQGRDKEGSRVSNETLSPSPESESEGFSDFVKAYPQPDGVHAAEELWNEIVSTGTAPESILSGLKGAHRAWKAKHGNDVTWIPKAKTWLASKGWQDHAPATEVIKAWEGPDEVRKAIVNAIGKDAAKSCFEASEWDGEQIIPRTTWVFEKLRGVPGVKDMLAPVRKAA